MDWMGAVWCLYCLVALLPVINGDDFPDYKDEEGNCLPELADKCFSDVYTNLACHLDPTSPSYCEKYDADDLCSASADALSCAKQIIDTSCKPEEGRNDFDVWIQGLQGIYSSVCEGNFNKLKTLLKTAKCWNGLSFLKCVEKGTEVGHIVDLLHSKLDLNRCSRFMISMATCNVRATNQGRSCQLPQDIVNEVIHAFFTNTTCGQLEFCSGSHPKLKATLALAVGAVYLYFHLP